MGSKALIERVRGCEILDFRGHPIAEVDVILNSAAHAANNVDIQKFMIMPVSVQSGHDRHVDVFCSAVPD